MGAHYRVRYPALRRRYRASTNSILYPSGSRLPRIWTAWFRYQSCAAARASASLAPIGGVSVRSRLTRTAPIALPWLDARDRGVSPPRQPRVFAPAQTVRPERARQSCHCASLTRIQRSFSRIASSIARRLTQRRADVGP